MKSKRIFRGIAAGLAVALAGLLIWPAVMSAQVRTGNAYYYFFQVQNEYDEPFTTDAFVNCSIYQYNDNGSIYGYTHSAASLSLASAQAGPLYSNTNGIIHWYSASANPVDVVCYTRAGDSGRKIRMSIREHRLRIVTSGMDKVVRFPIAGSTTPVSTGVYIPQGAIVQGVALNIVTPGATVAHVDIGFGGNHAFAFWNGLADRLQAGPNTITASAGFNTFMDPTGAVAAAWPGIGGIQSIPRTHAGSLLKHYGAAAAANAGAYNGGVMVHTTGGLELRYVTSLAGPLGGHGFVFFRLLHTGSTVTGTGY